jgi:hypothetical protein
MFDLLDRPLHWIPVKWAALVPAKKCSDLSVQGHHEIELRVELIDREEATGMFPALFDKDDEPVMDGFGVFKRVVKDWRKIKANGQAVPLTDENIKLLLNVPCFEAAFAVAYVTALAGQAEVREGNSSASPRGGRGDIAKAATTPSNGTVSVSA